MPLILLCGQPCSGKSTAAAELCAFLRESPSGAPRTVVLIDEPSLHLDRNDGYKDTRSEKNLRGLLRSAVDRAVTKDKFIVVDSLNNIKGYRYELWCLAKAAATRYCLLHTSVTPEQATEWNAARRERGEASYTDAIMEDLVRRFERPDSRNRWESPLFELHPASDTPEERIVVLRDLVSAMTGDNSALGGRGAARNLQPTIATQTVRLSETNLLYELDRATQEVVTAVVQAQGSGVGTTPDRVEIGAGLPAITLRRSVGLPELRRHKRTFIKLASQTALSGPSPPSDALSAKKMFVDYLNRELALGL